MQNNAALVFLVSALSAIILFNSGCNGAKPTLTSFGSIAVPTTGVCGAMDSSGDISVVTSNTCVSGTLEDIADSTTDYLWNCLGANGGKTAVCSLALPPPSVLPGTSNGLMNDGGYFYVGIDTAKGAIGHVHADTGFSTPCGISKDSVANEDITCIIEMPEGDIYGQNVEIKLNAPPGEMCRYIQTEPYWFYNYEVGEGPAVMIVSVDNTVNASNDITASTYTCSFDGVIMPCDSHPEIVPVLNPTNQKYNCVYNHTLSSGPNCCFGEKNITTTTTTNGIEPVVTTSTTTWGGNYETCIGGPGRTNWPKYYSDGKPARTISFVEPSGFKTTHNITSPGSFAEPLDPRTASIHVASYYGDSATHTHTGFVDLVTTSNLPFFMDPIDDRNGTAIDPAHPSFEFQCLDAAFEVKHRIRAYIREWDTMPDFLAYIDSLGTVVIPDRGQTTEPNGNCSGLNLSGSMCNDSYDIDDFLSINLLLPGENTSELFPGLTGPTYEMTPLIYRKQYFPRIQY